MRRLLVSKIKQDHRALSARVGGSRRTGLLGTQRGTPCIAVFPKQLSWAEKNPQGPSLLHKELAVSGWASKGAKLAEDLLEGAGSSEM